MKVKKVLGYRLLVKREEIKSESGIILTGNEMSLKAMQGTVVMIGSDVSAVAVGDNVAWAKYSDVSEITTDEGTLVIMNSEDILLTLD